MSWEAVLAYGSMTLLIIVGILLMIVILLQRGRGGGLAGAFGGAGGQSAFGTRAGDVFTKITAVMAFIWITLAGVSRFALEPLATQQAASFQSESEFQEEQSPGGAATAAPGENQDDSPAGTSETTEGEAPNNTEEP